MGFGGATTNGAAQPIIDDATLDQIPVFTFPGPMMTDNPPFHPAPFFGPNPPAANPPTATHARTNNGAPKPQWVIPPPPGPTLRQRVERREREMGLRCSDVSCGLGPTDEDPEPTPGVDVTKVRQVGIRRKGDEEVVEKEEMVCEHRFHCACLVSAERVAGWGGGYGDGKEEEKGEEGDVEVSCPVCRAVGVVRREEWEEGVAGLM